MERGGRNHDWHRDAASEHRDAQVRFSGTAQYPRHLIVGTSGDIAIGRRIQDLAGLIPTSAGVVQPADLDELGRMGICGFIHKFTDASVQIGAASASVQLHRHDHAKYVQKSFGP